MCPHGNKGEGKLEWKWNTAKNWLNLINVYLDNGPSNFTYWHINAFTYSLTLDVWQTHILHIHLNVVHTVPHLHIKFDAHMYTLVYDV